jgi:DNA repair exonuclease SbcCD nuclease subunit
MKVAYCSDLHLEFGDIELKNTEDADILILAGDILLAEILHEIPQPEVLPDEKTWSQRQGLAYRFRSFISKVSQEFPQVLVIAGNHEFYHGRWNSSLLHLQEEYSVYPNVKFLERECVIFGDVVFIGATLWTDMNKKDPITLQSIKYAMNDFALIKNDTREYRKLQPEETVIRHQTTLDYIHNTINKYKGKKFVFIGHHSPSRLSTHPKYTNDYEMNGGYSSSLTQFIYDHPEIEYWIHGHTHHSFDYYLGQTNIICNPRGYHNHEESAKSFELKYFEV